MYYKKVLGLMFYGWVMLYANRMILSSCLPLIMEEFGLTYEAGSLLFVIYFYPYIVMTFVAGLIGDHVGRMKVLIVGTIFSSAISLLSGFSKTPLELSILRILLGFGHGSYFGNERALISAYTPKSKIGTGHAVSLTGMGIGMALGTALGGLLAQAYGWRYTFIVLSIPSFLQSFLISKFIKEPREFSTSIQKGKHWIHFLQSFKSNHFLLLTILNVIMMYAHWLLGTWIPTIIVETGIKVGTAAVYASLFGFSAVPGLLLFGALFDKILKKGISRGFLIAVSFTFEALSTFLMAFAIEIKVNALIISLLIIIEGLFIWGFFGVLYSLITYLIPSKLYGTGFGLLNSIGFVSSIVAPWLTGIVRDATGSFTPGLYIATLFMIFGFLLSLRLTFK